MFSLPGGSLLSRTVLSDSSGAAIDGSRVVAFFDAPVGARGGLQDVFLLVAVNLQVLCHECRSSTRGKEARLCQLCSLVVRLPADAMVGVVQSLVDEGLTCEPRAMYTCWRPALRMLTRPASRSLARCWEVADAVAPVRALKAPTSRSPRARSHRMRSRVESASSASVVTATST